MAPAALEGTEKLGSKVALWVPKLRIPGQWFSGEALLKHCGAPHLAKGIEDINVLVAVRGSKVQLPLVD